MQKRKIDDYLGRFLEDVQHRRFTEFFLQNSVNVSGLLHCSFLTVRNDVRNLNLDFFV